MSGQADTLTLLSPYVSESSSLLDAAALMSAEDQDDVFVLDPDGKPVGLLRQADVVRAVSKEADPRATKVSDVMLAPAPSIQEDSSGTEVASILRSKGIRRVLVKRGRDVVGLIEAGELFDLMHSRWGNHEVFKAISVRSRLRIAELLSVRPWGVEELAKTLGIKPITLRRHLALLKSQGIVDEIRPGSFGKVGRPSSLFSASKLILNRKPLTFS